MHLNVYSQHINKTTKGYQKISRLLLVIGLTFSIIMPLIAMMINIFSVNIIKIVTSTKFLSALKNSLLLSAIATILSVSLAYILAWCISRTAICFKGLFTIILSIPMLIPSISHGIGLVILFGTNGVMTNMFNLPFTIYGIWGIIMGSVLYSFPIAFLMVLEIFHLEDSTPYEAATVMGLSRMEKFKIITIPYFKKPMITVLFAVFTMVITDYGVPLMVGGKCITLPVMMYQDVIGMLEFGKGSVIGIILLIPALIACLVDSRIRENGNKEFVKKEFRILPQKIRDFGAYTICTISSLLVLSPIIVFSVLSFVNKYPLDMSLTFKHLQHALKLNAGQYLINSLFIAFLVSILGVLLAITSAYFTVRMPSKISGVLHLLSIMSLSIPGIVLGLSYVIFFKGSYVYGTFAILILANIIHFFSSPYLLIYNTFGKINMNLESVGMTLGISRWHIIKDILLPLSKDTILEMFSYFFVNSMITISAVSFLASVSNKPISLLIPQFEGQMQLECAAIVSLLIFIINMILKGTVLLLKKKK
ncbi:MAG: ABC transporter permease subunit [Lachnospiraceae bacterium]|nr:ABC transporter permease subunit [Lachnospiraceae bacterium]